MALQTESLTELSELLIEVIEHRASIGFLPPVTRKAAMTYWENMLGIKFLSDGDVAGAIANAFPTSRFLENGFG